MNPGRSRFPVVLVALFAAVPPVGVASASETTRVGGTGGERTVTMDCGANAFIVGASAKGGKDSLIGMNLVRELQFKCRQFSGTTPGDATTKTVVARATAAPTLEITDKFADCPKAMVATYLDLYAGWYIDRFDSLDCKDSTGGEHDAHLGVGGRGTGTRSGLNCPAGEGLYKIVARVGGNIDSLKGYCRRFGGVANLDPVIQIGASLRPSVSREAPIKILPGQAKTFTFTVPESAKNDRLEVVIGGKTDLLGAQMFNQPEYRVDLRNPAGDVVKTKTVSRSEGLETMKVSFGVAGAWKLQVTNLKKDYGALDLHWLQIAHDRDPPVRKW